MSIIIGLTGPTGSGKSSASRTARKAGIKVVDCDLLARKAVEKGTAGLTALVSAFGHDILLTDGALDRKKLAAAAFETPEKTELLNKTILPFIEQLVLNEIGNEDVLLDAPTLFESGLDSLCTKTIAVLADRETRMKRIIERDSLTIKEAVLRIEAGKDDGFYKRKADFILYNNGDEQTLIDSFNQIIKNIFGGF